jgi:hypothetical protein
MNWSVEIRAASIPVTLLGCRQGSDHAQDSGACGNGAKPSEYQAPGPHSRTTQVLKTASIMTADMLACYSQPRHLAERRRIANVLHLLTLGWRMKCRLESQTSSSLGLCRWSLHAVNDNLKQSCRRSLLSICDCHSENNWHGSICQLVRHVLETRDKRRAPVRWIWSLAGGR